MTTETLHDMTAAKKKPELTAEAVVARELVRQAREQGLSLTGPDGLLRQFQKTVIETALPEEMTETAARPIRSMRIRLRWPRCVPPVWCRSMSTMTCW